MPSPGVDETEPDHPAWVKLKEMHEHGDFEKLERIVDLWDSFETLGKVGMFLRWAVVKIAVGIAWSAALLASYGVLTGELQKWLSQK